MKFKRSSFMIVFLVLIVSGITSYANENSFSIQPILPKNQIDKVSGYFHIKLGKGEKQVLYVDIKNNTDETKTLRTSIDNATTNINGVIDYGKANNRKDVSLPVDLSKQVKVDKDITMEPKSSKQVAIEIEMPNESIDGVVAGGITFEQVNEVANESVNSNTNVKTKFSYVVALIIQQEEIITVLPELALEKIKTTQINQKPSMTASIRNVEPAYLNKMSIEVTIVRKNDKKEIYKQKKERMQFAPNSILEYPTFIENQKIDPGEYSYIAHIKGETSNINEETNQALEWTFTEDFKIDNKEAKKLNKLNNNKQDLSNQKLLYLFIGLTIILFLIIVIYIVFRIVKNKRKID